MSAGEESAEFQDGPGVQPGDVGPAMHVVAREHRQGSRDISIWRQRAEAAESDLASERAKKVEAEQERDDLRESRHHDETQAIEATDRALAAEATIEQARGLVADWDNVSRINLELALANTGTSALARHDAEVTARALEEAADDYATKTPGRYWYDPELWLRARAAEKRAEPQEIREADHE